jgi:putative alpha-1,2-mannosidase
MPGAGGQFRNAACGSNAIPNGKEFHIVTENLTDGNRYVGRLTLNGQPLTRSFVRH